MEASIKMGSAQRSLLWETNDKRPCFSKEQSKDFFDGISLKFAHEL